MNIALVLTIFRIILVPAIIWMMFNDGLIANQIARTFTTIMLYTVASVSDYFDGYFARKYKTVSRMGEFLDPLADKALTVSVFVAFIYMPMLYIPRAVIIFIGFIIIREVLITLIRILAILKDHPLKTEMHGKLKTTIQITCQVTVLTVLFYHSFFLETKRWAEYYSTQAGKAIDWIMLDGFQAAYGIVPDALHNTIRYIPSVLIFLSFLITVYSGISYLRTNKDIFSTQK